MTEADTFLALIKPTYEDMLEKFIEIHGRYKNTGNYGEWARVREETAARHGWKLNEWQKENYIRMQRK